MNKTKPIMKNNLRETPIVSAKHVKGQYIARQLAYLENQLQANIEFLFMIVTKRFEIKRFRLFIWLLYVKMDIKNISMLK